MLQLMFNPELTLTGFRTTQPRFGHLEERISHEEVQFKSFCYAMKTSCPTVENIEVSIWPTRFL